jgi:hypothetical protein
MIYTLKQNEIFVFGSNTGGYHGAGAALLAKQKFGAIQRRGEGLMGQSYALPTLKFLFTNRGQKFKLIKRTHEELAGSVANFIECASVNSNLTFLLTKVGCGLAGYSEGYMKSFFTKMPSNVIKPEGW